jgi:XTP/dITP diphosphohydrolase
MEELTELDQAFHSNKKDAIEDEFGDVLFSLINYARFIKVNPETALERTNKKFIKRFKYIEVQAKKHDRSINDLNIEEMEAYWQEAKYQSDS